MRERLRKSAHGGHTILIKANFALDCPKFSGRRYRAVEPVATLELISLRGIVDEGDKI